MHVRLHGQLGKSQQHTGKNVNDDLLGNTRLVPAEHGIPSQQTSKEAVKSSLLSDSRGVRVSQHKHRALVYESEGREVPGMLACGFQDKLCFFSEGSRAKEKDHH